MPTTQKRAPVAQEPTPFALAVRERAWDWLLELRRRLKVDLVLVDGRLEPLVAPSGADSPRSVRALLDAGDPSVAEAIDAALETRTVQTIDHGGLQISCLAIAGARGATGALVVGRAPASSQEPSAARAQLELAASWLASAVESHLGSLPTLAASGLDRVAPLAHLLGEAAEREADRELVRLFGEAIAVWHDVDLSGFVETSGGAFMRDVTLPGTRVDTLPGEIPADGAPESGELARLRQDLADRFDVPVDTEIYVRRIRRNGGRSWLLVFVGAIDAQSQERLSAYVTLLELALALSTTAVTARLVTAVSRRLADVSATSEERARRALAELRTALGATSGSVSIDTAKGAPLLRVGEPASASTIAGVGPTRLVLVKQSERHYTTTVSLSRPEDRPFSPRDHEAASAVLEMLAAWAPAAFAAAPASRERRAEASRFQSVLERSARDAIGRGAPVTIVVLVVPDAPALPGSTQRWVAGIRGQMRASDLAGMLAEGEIGLLMQDTTAAHARSIAERLRTVVGTTEGRQSILIGVASRAPGGDTVDGLVTEARSDAIASVQRGRSARRDGGEARL